MSLPDIALSVRQPWAWAIMHGKNIENRSWHVRHPARKEVDRIRWACIHAAQGMTKGEYEDAAEFIEKISGVACPPPHELIRGAIIGSVGIIGGITKSDSPWFFGPYGIVLANPVAIATPIRAKGELGWFKWQPSEEPWPETAKWMQPKEEELL